MNSYAKETEWRLMEKKKYHIWRTVSALRQNFHETMLIPLHSDDFTWSFFKINSF